MSRIFSFFLFLFLTLASYSFAAQPSTYLVENITVNVSGKSPNDARNLAVASARRDAFLILLTRLSIPINVADNISNDEISEMVRSEQIDGEKLAGNSYSASFNILFAKDFVDHILSGKNAAKTEEKKEEAYLLIPAKILKRKVILWEEANDWRRALVKAINKKSTKKFIIPEADVSNISMINRDNIESADYATLEPMLSRYKTDAAYTLFFNFDEIENKVYINVSYIRKLQKKQIKLGFINVDRLSYEALLEKVANKTVEYLNGASANEATNLGSSLIRIGIPISSLGNWLQVKNRIENSNLVSQLNIESISRDYAIVTVNYVDVRVDIVEGFAKVGLVLDKKSENFYILAATN